MSQDKERFSSYIEKSELLLARIIDVIERMKKIWTEYENTCEINVLCT